MVNDNKDKSKIKLLYNELLNKNKIEIMNNYDYININEYYKSKGKISNDVVDEFERELKELKSKSYENNQKIEMKVDNLINKTNEIALKQEKTSIEKMIESISSKIMEEMKIINDNRIIHLENELKNTIKSNSDNVDKLQKIIIDLKDQNINTSLNKESIIEKDHFNKTASFKDSEHVNINHYALYSNSNNNNKTIKQVIIENGNAKIQFYRELLEQNKISNTEFLLKKNDIENKVKDEILELNK